MTSQNPASVQFAARFAGSVVERLRTRASREAQSQRQLAERYIDEGLRMDDHPGIVFRPGPMGDGPSRGSAAGPDVWEIVAALKQLPTRGEAAGCGASPMRYSSPARRSIAGRSSATTPAT